MRYFWLVIGILIIIRMLIATYKFFFVDDFYINNVDVLLGSMTLSIILVVIIIGILYLTINYW